MHLAGLGETMTQPQCADKAVNDDRHTWADSSALAQPGLDSRISSVKIGDHLTHGSSGNGEFALTLR